MIEIVLAAILSVARAPAVDVIAERPRLEAIAAAITSAAEASDGAPFLGEARVEAAALMLVAIGAHESGWRANVGDCRERGDGGRSVTYWQIMRGPNWQGHTMRELCTDVGLAASVALRVFQRAAAHTATTGGATGLYAGAYGTASRDVCASWERLSRRAGLVGATCSTRWRAITFAPEP